MESTVEVYAGGKLFNFLIQKNSESSIRKEEKYNVIEYNPEYVDHIFQSEEDSATRIMYHLVFGKYLHNKVNKSMIADIILDYQNNPFHVPVNINLNMDEDLTTLDEYLTVFNMTIESFDIKDLEMIKVGKKNFFKDFFSRIWIYAKKILSGNSLPWFASSSYVISEIYLCTMSSEDLTINNLVLSKDNLYNFRRPRDDITSYFVKHIGFKYDFFNEWDFNTKKRRKEIIYDISEGQALELIGEINLKISLWEQKIDVSFFDYFVEDLNNLINLSEVISEETSPSEKK